MVKIITALGKIDSPNVFEQGRATVGFTTLINSTNSGCETVEIGNLAPAINFTNLSATLLLCALESNNFFLKLKMTFVTWR